MSNVRREMDEANRALNTCLSQLRKAEDAHASAVMAVALAGELTVAEARNVAARMADNDVVYVAAASRAGAQKVIDMLAVSVGADLQSDTASGKIWRSRGLEFRALSVDAAIERR